MSVDQQFAINLVDGAGAPVHALAGFRLVGLGQVDVELERMPYEIGHVLRRLEVFIIEAAFAGQGRWLELHYSCLRPPGGQPPQTQVLLFCGASGEDAAQARQRALQVARSVRAALPDDLGLYEFESIRSTQQLAQDWAPFEPRSATMLRKRTVHTDHLVEVSPLPLLTVGSPSDFAAVPRVIQSAGCSARLRVALRPTRVLPWEEQRLEALIKGQDLSSDTAPGLRPYDVAARAQALELLRTPGQVLLVRVLVESSQRANRGLAAAIAHEISEGELPAGMSAVNAALEPLPLEVDPAAAVLPALPGHAVQNPGADLHQADRLKDLFTVREASRVFRLPVPGQPLMGLPTRATRLLVAPPSVPTDGLWLGRNGRRSDARPVALPDASRCRHLYTMGQTGTGKSTFLHSLIMQDIAAGRGVCVIDPHGDLVELIMATMPAERIDDVALLDPADTQYPVGINPLATTDRGEQDRVAEEFLTLVHRLWRSDFVGPVFQYNIRNTLLLMMHLGALGQVPAPPTILGLPRYVRDSKLLRKVKPFIKDPQLLEFVNDVLETADFHRGEMRGYLISKFNVLLSHEGARNLVGQRQTKLDIRRLVEQEKILLVRLPSGELGEVACRFLGFLFLLKLQNVIMARAGRPADQRTPLYLYVDEFQNFLTETLPILLAEGRKFAVNIVLANQYLGQLLDEKVRDRLHGAIFGNVGTLVSFRLGNEDSDVIARQLGSPIKPAHLVNLPNFEAFARVLTGAGAPPVVSLRTEPWPVVPEQQRAQACREASRAKYGRPAAEVHQEIRDEAEALERLSKG